MKRRVFSAGLGACLVMPAWANVGRAAPPEVAAELGAPRLAGSGRLRFFGLHVYDARLWSAQPVTAADWADRALAIEVEYARRLEGHAIAERSLEEMRRQREIPRETAERWLRAMKSAFPDVGEGDRLTGVHRPGEGVRFFANGRLSGELREPEFARQFFGIWLSEQSSQPALRTALLGGAR